MVVVTLVWIQGRELIFGVQTIGGYILHMYNTSGKVLLTVHDCISMLRRKTYCAPWQLLEAGEVFYSSVVYSLPWQIVPSVNVFFFLRVCI